MPRTLQNPFRDARRQPEWAQLTRLAGDRAAILFEQLRSEISAIDGLVEDLHYLDSEAGWVPRYRVGQKTLLTVHIYPGVVEANLELQEPLREKLVAARNLGRELPAAIRETPASGPVTMVRVRLGSRGTVRALGRAVRLRSRFVALDETK